MNPLKGIGEKTGKLFGKLGVVTIDDPPSYYSRTYDIYKPLVSVGQLKEQAIMAVESALVRGADLLRLGHMQIALVQLKDLTSSLQASWYDMSYMRVNLKAGITCVFRGRAVKERGRVVTKQPEIFAPDGYQVLTGFIQPVYGQTRGLSNKTIVRAWQMTLEMRKMEREYTPPDLRRRYELAETSYAMEHTHFPADQTELLLVRKCLVFDESFMLLVGVRRLKEHKEDRYSAFMIKESEKVVVFQSSLPCAPTGAQERVLREVHDDMGSGLMMNRLVQGDVGSGKTIITVLVLLEAAYNGYQGALMVPTEMLTRQHFESVTDLSEKQGTERVPMLVTGSMTAKEKRLACAKIVSHGVDIIIDTHALIQEEVMCNNLALATIDEQHRLGVEQGELLSNRGQEPHMLVMGTTSIPRALAIILYGNLGISVTDELPAGRQTIKNCVVDPGYRPKAYAFIGRQVARGHQVYVIRPMVEESETIEAGSTLGHTRALRKALLPSVTVKYFHDRLKGRKKDAVMERFIAGKIHVLVSTTVIEVGVNVPGATMMMIENAERFGLIQLRQFRGWVGRGKDRSYYIMVSCPRDQGARERLNILDRPNDGSYTASKDLKLRRPGDIFRLRQNGNMEFKPADISTDANILKKASEEINQFLGEDSQLEKGEHKELKQKVEDYLGTNYEKLSL